MVLPATVPQTWTPRVVLGWREQRTELTGCRVEVHQNAHQVLRDVSDSCLDFLRSARIRAYEPFAALESDEVFILGSTDEASPVDLDSASIAKMVWQSDQLQTINASTIKDKYLFYAIVWSSADGPELGFIRKKNARATVSSGSFFGLNNGALKVVEVPDFVVDSSADIVVYDDSLYMLNENSARVLLNDTGIATSGLPANIQALATVLGGSDSMTPSAATAIEAVALRKTNVARQLARLPEFFNGMTVNTSKLRTTALERCSNPDELVNGQNIVCVEEGRVEELLDLVAGRLYLDTVTDEERRAERVSRRSR